MFLQVQIGSGEPIVPDVGDVRGNAIGQFRLLNEFARNFAHGARIDCDRAQLPPSLDRANRVRTRDAADVEQRAVLRQIQLYRPCQRRPDAETVHRAHEHLHALCLPSERLELILGRRWVGLRRIALGSAPDTFDRKERIELCHPVKEMAKVGRTRLQ